MKRKSKEEKKQDVLIGQRIARLIFEKKITQSDLAPLLNVNTNSVSNYMNGKTHVKNEYLSAIIKHFNLENDYFKIANDTDVDYVQENHPEYNSNINNLKTESNMDLSRSTIEELVKQNGELIRQVSRLISVQEKNAESILNLSSLGERRNRGKKTG